MDHAEEATFLQWPCRRYGFVRGQTKVKRTDSSNRDRDEGLELEREVIMNEEEFRKRVVNLLDRIDDNLRAIVIIAFLALMSGCHGCFK
jgi:hypothetical protein